MPVLLASPSLNLLQLATLLFVIPLAGKSALSTTNHCCPAASYLNAKLLLFSSFANTSVLILSVSCASQLGTIRLIRAPLGTILFSTTAPRPRSSTPVGIPVASSTPSPVLFKLTTRVHTLSAFATSTTATAPLPPVDCATNSILVASL